MGKNMTKVKKILRPNEEVVQQNILSEYISDKHQDHGKSAKNSQIRDDLFGEIIELMSNKRYYMLGPEKGMTARFIAENCEDIFQILMKRM